MSKALRTVKQDKIDDIRDLEGQHLLPSNSPCNWYYFHIRQSTIIAAIYCGAVGKLDWPRASYYKGARSAGVIGASGLGTARR